MNGHFINGYVIMPNHVHALISFNATDQHINTIVGNGKRFMAYEIIERLKQYNQYELLATLATNIEAERKAKNKKHNVWELSFDWKDCQNISFAFQKLDYMDLNPCRGKWNLCDCPANYLHSSAKFYLTGEQGIYPVNSIMDMQDIDLRNLK